MSPNKLSSYHHFLPLHVTFSLFIVSFWCLINSISSAAKVDDSEHDALLRWKGSLDKQSQDILASWHPNNTPCTGNWSGISCDKAGRVAGIDLYSYGLIGTLHALNFSPFTHLISINLGDNSLYGTLPSNMSLLSRLVYLSLPYNHFSGTIPIDICLLTNLEFLDITHNYLSGTIPAFIGNLTELTFLGLSRNELSGSIPFSIESLVKLKIFYLYGNQINGSIPEIIGSLTSLVSLVFSENKLSGPMPSSIGNLANLKRLFLCENQLSGEIPQEFNNLINLSDFQLAYNNLTGSLPDNICLGGKLINFTVPYNEFTGGIPRSLKNCTTLYRVRLEMNQLTGDLSVDLGIYPDLDFIDLSHNKFYGVVSRNWGLCQRLTSLSISNNKMSGTLPENLAEASQIQRLELGSNNLVGEIPKSFFKLTSLTVLKLDGNKLSGVLPKEIRMLSRLSSLNLGANTLSGIIPEEIGECRQLLNLNMSCNTFDGNIPLQIGNVISLQNLDLSHNRLSGAIPKELAQLQFLESLNLSHNDLSGFLPSALEKWVSLTSIDISNNQLEGPLPNSPAFQNVSFDSLKNNKGLCGDINGLNNPCSSDVSKETQKKKSDKVVILIGVFAGLFVMILIVGLFFCYQKLQNPRAIKPSTKPKRVEDLLSIWSFDGKMVYENIIEATENFNPQYCIGQGAYGSVYRAELPTGQVVAVKRLHSSEGLVRFQIEKSFESEIRALTELSHRNIVRLFGFCSHVRNSFLVYTFVDGDNLLNILKNYEQAKNFKWVDRLNFVNGVVDALSYMHHEVSPPLVHRDISSKNIVLDEKLEAHLTDFGTARFLLQNSPYRTSFAGTFGYSAPELAYTQEISEKCDVYSFGVLTLEVLMGRHPGDLISLLLSSSSTYSSMVLLNDIIDQRISPPLSDEIENVILITKLAFACLQQNPQSRPTMKDVSNQLAKSKPNNAGISFSSMKIDELLVQDICIVL